MNWSAWTSLAGFYSLGAAWLFSMLIPVIIFYFLKLRRPQMPIASLALWRSVLNDQRVNSPFQRFRRNLLLLFQLLLLIALALSAMQPFLRSGSERAQFLPILVDCSASMGALDKPAGQTRLAELQSQLHDFVDKLLPDQRAMIIAVDNSARRLTEFTDNRRILHAAIDELRVSDVANRLEDGLRMAQALSRSVSIETCMFYTDGNIPAEVDVDLPFNVLYQRIPAGGANLAITQMNARRGQTRWDLFARVEASAAAAVSGTAELYQDGKLVGETPVTLDAGGSQRLVFGVDTDQPAALEVRLRTDGFDSLASDNTVGLSLPAVRPVLVYCPRALESYRKAIAGIKNLQLFPDDDGNGTAASYDLVISDDPKDMALETTVGLFCGFIPNDLKSLVSTKTEMAEVVDWQRSAPLLQHVLLREVQIAENTRSAENVVERDYEELGYETLAVGASGPLIVQKEIGNTIHYHILFHTDQSTLPYRVGFPILVANAIQSAIDRAALSDVRAVQTGVLPPLNRGYTPETAYTVVGPQESYSQLVSSNEGWLTGVAVPYVGKYEIRNSGGVVEEVTAALLSSSESSLKSEERIQFRELKVSAASSLLQNDWPLWWWFATAGFVLLLGEWWLYQRRPPGRRE